MYVERPQIELVDNASGEQLFIGDLDNVLDKVVEIALISDEAIKTYTAWQFANLSRNDKKMPLLSDTSFSRSIGGILMDVRESMDIKAVNVYAKTVIGEYAPIDVTVLAYARAKAQSESRIVETYTLVKIESEYIDFYYIS